MRDIFMPHRPGRHFLQIPGPTNVPDRVLRALNRPTIDHRGPEFARLGKEVLEGCRAIFQTSGPVVMFPSSGTGAWEACIVNTLVPGDWRHGVDPAHVEARLAEDRSHAIRAVMVVHNETSAGTTSRIPEIRKAMDSAHHPALLMVDTVSS